MAIKRTDSSGNTTEYAADGGNFNGNIVGDGNADSFVVDGNSTLTSGIYGLSGNDSFRLDSGGAVGFEVNGDGYAGQTATYEVYNNSVDGLTPQQTSVGYYLDAGGSDDTITIDGSGYAGTDDYAIFIGEKLYLGAAAILGRGGNDNITVTDGVHLHGSIDVGVGGDVVSIGPDVLVEGSITSAAGDGLADSVTIAEGATVTDSIMMTSGNDTVSIAGHVGDGGSQDRITTGEGIDDLTIASSAVVNVSQINIGTTQGGNLTIEEGAEVRLYPGGPNPGAGILGTHGDDSIFLGGTYDSSHDMDVDGFGVSDDTFTLGSDFSAVNTGANSVFKINGGGNATALDYDTFDFSALAGRIASHDVDPDNAEHGTVRLTDGSVIEYFEMENVMICFAGGTRIMTDDGERVVEELRKNDLVLTKDNGLQSIRWIGSRKLSAEQLETSPNMRPIRIRAGALGKNLPESDLTVSPQHRVLVRSKIAQRMFNSDEVLVGAKHLLELDGVEIAADVTEVEYFHILFERHEVIFSNGAETESLHTGPQALKSLSPAARKEIFTLFPELQHQDPKATDRPMARLSIRGCQGKQLVMRHNKNGRELVA